MGGALELATARDFAIALLIGALIGLDRERKKASDGDVGIGGLRTFILFAQAGALSAWLGARLGTPWLFVATVLAVSGLVVAGYVVQARTKPRSYGLTTEIAAIGTCLLGGACLLGYPGLSVALGIITSAALALKQPLHGLVAKLGDEDINAGLKLLVASFVVLPLLPNHPIDPWQAINPYELWLLVVLISALSLVGYITIRWLGPGKGLLLTGLSGGLVSSTAVTLSFARRSREDTEGRVAGPLAAGILVAWAVMFARVIALVAVLHPPLVATLAGPFAAMGLLTLVFVGALLRDNRAAAGGSQEVPLQNPFSLTSAIKFALFFAVVLLGVKVVQQAFPGRGTLAVAALAGLTDVDAITLAMSRFASAGGDTATAAAAITVAALANTVTKAGMGVLLGGRGLGLRLSVVTVAIFVAGGLAIWAF